MVNELKQLRALGIGFTGMDIIKSSEDEIILPGGTCANVLSVLTSMLSWSADIVKCKYDDVWNEYINSLWHSLGITIFDCGITKTKTPRIVQVISGHENRQYTACPHCCVKLTEAAFPTKKKIDVVIEGREYDLFFLDRISPGAKFLLDLFSQQGKWTIYEPNSVRVYQPLLNNISMCDVVKFSDSRITKQYYKKLIDDLNNMPYKKTKIIIITHAEKGYSYSFASKNKLSTLKTITVNPLSNMIDSSGAGDWFSAGFIDKLVRRYPRTSSEIDEQSVIDSLLAGQSLAETCCTFVGALGGLFENHQLFPPYAAGFCDFCKSKIIV